MLNITKHKFILFIVDTLIFISTFWVIYVIKPDSYKHEFIISTTICISLWLYIMYLKDLYNCTTYRRLWSEAYHIFEAIALGTAIASMLFYFYDKLVAARSVLIIAAVVSYFGILIWRTLHKRYMMKYRRVRNVIIVGAGSSGNIIAEEIGKHLKLTFHIVGFVDDDPAKIGTQINNFPVMDACSSLPELIKQHAIDIIIVAITDKPKSNDVLFALAECLEQNVQIVDMVELYEKLAGKIPINHITNSWFIYKIRIDNKTLYHFIKRIFDIIGALLITFATLPIMIAVIIAIRSEGKGPVFYSQVRVGERGKTFRMHKFRTMVVNAEEHGAVWAVDNNKDPRVTPLGKIIRKLRFDELPQMYNILAGDISLVGPRPERPEFTAQLEKEIPFYQRRHWIRPGWTGWAQIMYKYGASVNDAHEKLQYDLYYVKNRSIFLDVSILLRAIAMAISGRHG